MATQGEPTGGIRTIKASEFKAKCLELMDELAGSGGEIVITKNGKPVSRLVPYRVQGDPTSQFALDKGRVKIIRRHCFADACGMV